MACILMSTEYHSKLLTFKFISFFTCMRCSHWENYSRASLCSFETQCLKPLWLFCCWGRSPLWPFSYVPCCHHSACILWCQMTLADCKLSCLLETTSVSHLSSFILNEAWVTKVSFPASCTSIGLLNCKKSTVWSEDWFTVESFSSFFIFTGFLTCMTFLMLAELWVAGKCFSLFFVLVSCVWVPRCRASPDLQKKAFLQSLHS